MPQSDSTVLTQKIIDFIREIGIEVSFSELTQETVLPGIEIDRGRIIIDRERLKYPGDLLHEAGHIAVVPLAERETLTPVTLASRKDSAAEEMMAIAWSYAAGVHLGIDAEVIFHNDGYHGGAKNIAEAFRDGRGFGVPMLEYVGLSERVELDGKWRSRFPVMLRWIRD